MIKLAKEPEVIEFIIKTKPKIEAWSFDDYMEYVLIDKTRTVFIYEIIGPHEAFYIARTLEYLATINSKPIHVIINCEGGEIYAGLMIYDSIRKIISKGIEVICEARGLAASMGCIILQAGSKRLSTKHSRFLLHETRSITFGKTSEQEEQVKELAKLNKMINEIISEKTGKSVDEVEKLCKKKDVWFSAEEAKDFGLLDEIV